jgi:ABC-type transporter Mla MlaB component
MDTNFNMFAKKMNGAIQLTLSGKLDESSALDVLRFLNLYARANQPIVMDLGDLSPSHNHGLNTLKTGLRTLSQLGHPIHPTGQQDILNP